jgi:hypothetical protein
MQGDHRLQFYRKKPEEVVHDRQQPFWAALETGSGRLSVPLCLRAPLPYHCAYACFIRTAVLERAVEDGELIVVCRIDYVPKVVERHGAHVQIDLSY